MSKDKEKEKRGPAAGTEENPELQAGGETEENAANALPEAEEPVQKQEPAGREEKSSKELEELKKQNEELNDRLLRNAAEFDNYRKRTQKEKAEMSSFGKALCMKEILSVVDNFERALAVECKDADFKKGMEMILKQMTDAIHRLGVEEIDAMNQVFNPELHNAIKQVEDESFGDNTVCQVLQKGYRLEGKVLRHSMVVVANP